MTALLLLAPACSARGGAERNAGSEPPSAPLALVAYQGQDVLGGSEVEFPELLMRGKPVVLNFWAGLCAPCRAEMPAFQAAYGRYADRVILVGVDVGPFLGLGSHKDAQALLVSLGITYPSAYAKDPAIMRQYELVAMPTTVFFDADGRQVKKYTGVLTEAQLEAEFQALVGAGR